MQQANHTNQYRLRRLSWIPSLANTLEAVLVFFWWMENRYAEEAVVVDVGMEWNWRLEFQGGR